MQSALAAGKLKRQPCEQCGAEPADAHHDDYAKPLEVRWLCRAHHMEWHRLNGPGLNGEGVSSLTHLEDTEQAAE